MIKLIALIVVLVGACSSSKGNVIIKDGISSYDIKCPNIGGCLEQAGNYCPNGFTLTVHSGTKSASHISQWKPSPDGNLHLLVSCK